MKSRSVGKKSRSVGKKSRSVGMNYDPDDRPSQASSGFRPSLAGRPSPSQHLLSIFSWAHGWAKARAPGWVKRGLEPMDGRKPELPDGLSGGLSTGMYEIPFYGMICGAIQTSQAFRIHRQGNAEVVSIPSDLRGYSDGCIRPGYRFLSLPLSQSPLICGAIQTVSITGKQIYRVLWMSQSPLICGAIQTSIYDLFLTSNYSTVSIPSDLRGYSD